MTAHKEINLALEENFEFEPICERREIEKFRRRVDSFARAEENRAHGARVESNQRAERVLFRRIGIEPPGGKRVRNSRESTSPPSHDELSTVIFARARACMWSAVKISKLEGHVNNLSSFAPHAPAAVPAENTISPPSFRTPHSLEFPSRARARDLSVSRNR